MSFPDPHTPSLLRRKGCWLSFLTGIPLLIGLAWVVEDQAGQRYLAKTKARLAAEGRVLDPEKILPARPPSEENFCAVPLLLDIGKGNPTGLEFEAVKQIADWEYAPKEKGGIHYYTSQEHPAPTDWKEVYRLITRKDPKSGLPPVPEEDVPVALAAIIEAKGGTSFAELEAALDRPRAIMLPTGREEPETWEPGQGLVWFNELRACSTALGFRARVALAAGDPDRAARTLRVMLRLADGAEAHGSLVAGLIGISIRSLATSVAWTGLRARAFNAEALRALGPAFGSYDGLASMLLAFRGEAIVFGGAWRNARTIPEELLVTAGSTPKKWHRWAFQLVPGGWWDYNEAILLSRHADWRAYLADESNPHRFATDSWPGWNEFKGGLLRHDWLASIALPPCRSVPSSFATNLTVSRLAETACALEAWFIVHQSDPASLDALVPDFLSDVPVDLDRKPIRYAQDPGNGRYKLWSVGVNGTDEGGVEKRESGSGKPRPWREPVGDWVWQYP